MPHAYTHVRIARAALRAGAAAVDDNAAFRYGANGPDIFFTGVVHKLRGPHALQALGVRMHAENCGLFLQALLAYAHTPVQRSYAAGFLLHYAADCTMHPYVQFCSEPGGIFEKREGHAFCEAAIDSLFHEADCGTPRVYGDEVAPRLSGADLAEVCGLLRRSIAAVYGETLSMVDISDTLHNFRLASRFCGAKRVPRHAAAFVAEHLFLHRPGYIVGHMTPAKQPVQGFPRQWVNPHTGEPVHAGPHALAMRAMQAGVGYLVLAQQYWCGEATLAQIAPLLGNNSYNTGMPILPKPAPQPDDATPRLHKKIRPHLRGKLSAKKSYANTALPQPVAKRKKTHPRAHTPVTASPMAEAPQAVHLAESTAPQPEQAAACCASVEPTA